MYGKSSFQRAAATVIASALFLTLATTEAEAQRIQRQTIASGFSAPLYLTSPANDARLFVLEQNTARVKIIKNGAVLATPFLDIGSLASQNGERGLLGLAFHPDYANNRKFYVNYTNNGGTTVIAEYLANAGNPDLAVPGSARIILTINQPFSNHNGGWIGFGPFDGYLYIGMGDGGSGGDPINAGQRDNTLLGKILRIDIDRQDPGLQYAIPPSNPFVNQAPLDEIWAKGVRNPWRCAFDLKTGDLYIADVGQNVWEEVSFQPGSSQGGENYGWRLMEGDHCFNPPTNCNPNNDLEIPIHEYNHGGSPFRCSITGGYSYRGDAIPGLQGTYFFGDFCSSQIWSFRWNGSSKLEFKERTSELQSFSNITSFGEDADGEMYFIAGSSVIKIVPDLMTLSATSIVAGSSATLDITDASSNAMVTFFYSLRGVGVTPLSGFNANLGIRKPVSIATRQANGAGAVSITVNVPLKGAGRTVWVQAAENGNTSNVIEELIQ